jgi:DNA-binding CsgD family transcriptional regulator
MDELAQFDRLVSLIYELPLFPERLQAILADLTRALDGDTCHLVGWQGQSQAPLLSATIGLDEGIGPDYAAHYAAIDPRRQYAMDHLAPGQVLACHEQFDARFVSRSEFFQDYLLPIGVHYMLASTLVADPRHLVQIAFQRYARHEHFSEHEKHLTERLIPHLQRSMALLMHGDALRQDAVVSRAGLEASPFAVIAVDAGCRPLFRSRQAEAVLRDGGVLRETCGTLHAVISAQDEALVSAVAIAAMTGKAAHLLVTTPPGAHEQARYGLTIAPVKDPGRHALHGAATVLCIIVPLAGRRLATAAQLMALFGLTPAEARLARALAQGMTLDDYAKDCGLRRPTVKTQLMGVFAKTGTKRQVDLVRLIMDIPAIRS